MSQAGPQRNRQLQRARDPENHAGPIPIEAPFLAVARIFQGLLCHHESQQLGGVRGLYVVGRDAEGKGVEGHR